MKEYLELRTGQRMPMVGLGTGKLGLGSGQHEFDEVIECALDLGYRYVDTAARYGNENFLGNALRKWTGNEKARREELFIVTKSSFCIYVAEDEFNPKDKNGKLLSDNSTDIIAVWEATESMVDCGKAKSIGLSNFNEEQIERILKSCRIPPANLQIEVHVYCQQKALREFCHRNDIQVCAYAPLASPFRRNYPNASELNIPALLEDETVKDIARYHGKTCPQILLRYLVQALAVSVIPKTCNLKRLRENFEIFDFELTSQDIARLRDLDRGENGRTWQAFDGATEHPECPF